MSIVVSCGSYTYVIYMCMSVVVLYFVLLTSLLRQKYFKGNLPLSLSICRPLSISLILSLFPRPPSLSLTFFLVMLKFSLPSSGKSCYHWEVDHHSIPLYVCLGISVNQSSRYQEEWTHIHYISISTNKYSII